ncbi:MAG TPA: translation initiation factor IF-2, partial [Vineibacter sp.]|nr:translation initiation factor IF-2 [Vineibacter sp.]
EAAPAASKSAPVAAPESPTFRREDYIAPTGVANKPPLLVSKVEKPVEIAAKKAADAPPRVAPRPSGPAIRVAPMPTVQQPVAPAAPAEPEPQKPDIKLPADAIRASKAGAKPLQAHLRKHEAKRKAETAPPPPPPPSRGRGPGGPGGPRAPAPPPPPLPGDSKERRRTGAPAKSGTAPATEGGGDDRTLGGREQRQNRRRAAAELRPLAMGLTEEEAARRVRPRSRPKLKKLGTNTAAPRKGKAIVQLPCTVRSFSETLGIRASQVQGKLLTLGTMANINTELNAEMIELLAVEFGAEVEVRQPVDLESQLISMIQDREDAPESLQPRAPVVTFLGHVDHGKTSLLDKIIGIDVVSGESGGITQHIRAYKIDKDGREITFVDTPGHEAFTEMRARGANVTDIAVLVVAADDGVMPQTEEAISHARAAKVPIVVAMNKIDLPGIDPTRIMQQLAANELLPTEWGGDTEVVQCSALTGLGMDDLLETLLTIAELHDYKANPDRQSYGTCLEAELHEGRGVVAKLLVQNGTLKVGDVVVCGAAHGRVKAMYDTLDGRRQYDSAGPSTPVNVTGLNIAPGAGDHFYVLDEITNARDIAEKRSQQSRQVALGGAPSHVTLENLHERLGKDEVQTLNLVLRADVRGSIEAILKELGKLTHPEVQIKVLQATVGGISEADVHLADASDAVIIGFNVVPDEGARTLAEAKNVQIRRYDIIYKVTDDLKASLEGMLKPEKREVDLGRALVQRTFTISRVGTIAGCRVLAGTIERNSRVRVIRENRIIGEYPLESLKREKDDAREVREGYECGMKLGGFNDLKEGDILEVYKIQEVARTL